MTGLDIEYEILPFTDWLFGRAGAADGTGAVPSALLIFFITALVLLLIGVLFAFISAAIRYGPDRGARVVGRALAQAPADLLKISPRRILGLTVLAMRESFRRRVWVTLAVFIAILMFAGWVLNPDSDQPALLYINFVLSATTYLMFPVVVLLGAFSLPNDIKNRTIYTVACKPVRASEIVLGRILGFIGVGTILLAVMGVGSYIFVGRGLDHVHLLTADDLQLVDDEYVGQTALSNRHRHDVSLAADVFAPELELAAGADAAGPVVTRTAESSAAAGLEVGDVIQSVDGKPADGVAGAIRLLRGEAGSEVEVRVRRGGQSQSLRLTRTIAETYAATNKGHRHHVTARWNAGEKKIDYEVGPPEDMLMARVPRFGSLRFLDRQGQPKERGISVGKVYALRSYVAGGTQAAAIWKFDRLDPNDFPDGLPLDMNIRVFRSFMGSISSGIRGSIQLVNPDNPDIRSREFTIIVGGAQDKLEKGEIAIAKEYRIGRTTIPLKTRDPSGNRLDIFDDLAGQDGSIEVWLRCLDAGRYFGVAYADVYVRARDASYPLNFVKGVFGVWMQMAIVSALTVLFSTILSGPIALLATITTIILSFFKGFLNAMIFSVLHGTAAMREAFLAHERYYGGGPLEAMYRVITQMNLMSPLPENGLTWTIKKIDYGLAFGLEQVLRLIPDFKQFDEVSYLSHGYDVRTPLMLQHLCATLAFLLAAYVIGYFLLKRRELAA